MRLITDNAPPEAIDLGGPRPGDVYSKAGGQPGFWLVVAATSGGYANVLAYDLEGNITGAQRYSAAYFEERDHRRVGRCTLPDLSVEWRARP
jgi:hypothetical protein